MENEFYCQPQYVEDRTGNYAKQTAIAEKWSVVKQRQDGNGNVSSTIYFDPKDGFKFKKYEDRLDSDIPLYRLISPALAMYRLVCIFFETPKCYDGYKMVWEYNLKHKETGIGVSLSEWKGAFGIWTTHYSFTEVSGGLRDDIFELLGHLVSKECAHPYDGLVAGSVA